MIPDQEDSSGQAKFCSADQPSIDIAGLLATVQGLPAQVVLLIEENERLQAKIAQQKMELEQMSSTFKTIIALKNRKIKDIEDEMKQMTKSAEKTAIERSPSVKKSKEESMAYEEPPVAVSEVEIEAEGVPEDVSTLDMVNKLNELIDPDRFDLKHPFWGKISPFYGDITKINVDVIVTSASDQLVAGGTCYRAIHIAAGYNQFQSECRKRDRPVPIGQAVMTDACGLSTHVKKIILCVGPIAHSGVSKEARNKLESCYRRAVELSEQNGFRSIAFCCISTGTSGYDNKDAARTVIKFFYKHLSSEQNAEKWDRVVLCLVTDIDKQHYKHYITQLIRNPSLFDDDEEDANEY